MQSNHILARLPDDAFKRLEPHLSVRPLNVRDVIERRGEPPASVYFPLSGIISVVYGPVGDEVEISIVGRGGMTAIWALLGAPIAPTLSFVQVEGKAAGIAWHEFASAAAEFPIIQRECLLSVSASMEQIAGTAWANARSTVAERLARWLLLCHDRLDGDEISMTHDFLSIMLGVRRPGVTLALQSLESAGLIRNTRGKIVIRDRARLEEVGGRATE